MLAGLGAGIYRETAEAIDRCVRLDPPVDPDPRTGPAYAEAAAAFRELAASTAVRRAQAPDGRSQPGG